MTVLDREIRLHRSKITGGRPWAIAWMLLLIEELERRASFHFVGKYDLVRDRAGEDCGCRNDGIRPRVLLLWGPIAETKLLKGWRVGRKR